MPRPRRPLAPGLLYHVTTRGNERRDIFRDDADRRRLTAFLDDEVDRRRWEVHTACLMPNHVHLLLRTPGPDLSVGMHRLLTRYADSFNRRHERTGHLVGGRYHSVVVSTDPHHLELFRYIALNPVRAGLADDPSEFPWSTHAALRGDAVGPEFLSAKGLDEVFNGDRLAYADFVAAPGPPHLLDALLASTHSDRIRAASDAGFSHQLIASRLGVSRATVQRALSSRASGQG